MDAKKNANKWVLKRKNPKSTQPVKVVPLSKSSDPVRPYRDDRGNVTCPSCGEMLHETRLVEHLAHTHGFSKPTLQLLVESEKQSKSSWVNVLQGGLPSLGKRR